MSRTHSLAARASNGFRMDAGRCKSMQSRLCPLLIRDPQGLSCAPEVSLLSCTPPGQPCHGAASLRVPPRVWPGRWAALTSPCSPLELIATCTRIEWVPLVRIARVVTQPRHGMQEGSCSGADRPLVAAQTLARLSRSTVTGAGQRDQPQRLRRRPSPRTQFLALDRALALV